MKIQLLLCADLLTVANTASAETLAGGGFGVGQSLGGQAHARVATSVHVLTDVGHGWALGGEVSGSFEGYTGGWGCGTIMGSGTVPSAAVTCLQPSLAGHVLAGTRAAPSPGTRLRLDVGVGAGSIWLLPGGGGSDQATLVPSGLVRVSYLVRLGRSLHGEWWVGLALEERGVVYNGVRAAASVGLVLEGR